MAALVIPPVLMLARTGAPKPMEESCRLVPITRTINTIEIKLWKSRTCGKKKVVETYLSETVLSKSTNAPPQINRISLVSTYREIKKKTLKAIFAW